MPFARERRGTEAQPVRSVMRSHAAPGCLAPRAALWYGSAYMLFVLFIWEDKKKERNPSGWEMEIGWGVKKAMNFRAGLYRGCRGY